VVLDAWRPHRGITYNSLDRLLTDLGVDDIRFRSA
jgi:hypothetical protein